MKTKTVFLRVATVALLVGAAGCGSSGGGYGSTSSKAAPSSASQPSSSAPKNAANAATMTIKGFKFQTPTSVAPGTTITVKNEDSEAHTVTADGNGGFDVKVDPSGGTATFKAPTTPGSYKIKCKFHANMAGILVVK